MSRETRIVKVGSCRVNNSHRALLVSVPVPFQQDTAVGLVEAVKKH